MTNFNFLLKEFPQLYHEAKDAEQHTFTAPRFSALLCRSTIEKAVNWLYENDEDLEFPYDNKLASLLSNQDFKNILKPSMYRELDVVRRTGNNAAHGKKVSQHQALQSLKFIFRFLSFISVYYSEESPLTPLFNETLIPTGKEDDKSNKELKDKAAALEEQVSSLQKERDDREALMAQNELLRKQVEQQLKELSQRKLERQQTVIEDEVIPQLSSEAATRKLLIDVMLAEAGWDNLNQGRELEYPVVGMPSSTNSSGNGFADYVLWGDNGKPLAVIEAKSTLHESEKGKHQAFLYANCLEQMTGQRPVIFYTNGYENYIWDDTFYNRAREVYGFYTKEELQLLIDRRTTRKDVREFKVNTDIAGRYYQLEAIKRVAENLVVTNTEGELKGNSREALLVMATGSGKTRTAAAIVDMLTKSNWAKRILFLADRTALVSQAKNSFKEQLPHLSAIDLTKEKEDNGTRLVFSTYPTIMNKIDSLKNDDGRFYGVGHFDAIIIDEAHRSVYQKYQAIFDYFDCLLIGLTATPKKEVDRNTYGLFGIEDDNPTFSYELNQAVSDKFLVPPKAIKVPIKYPLEGVKYNDLSDEDKLKFEELFGNQFEEKETVDLNIPGEKFKDAEISKSQINKFLFNTDTVDKVLDYVLTHGIKVAGGDKLGKTIVFAKNHKHAVFIQERFEKNYPQYGKGNFLQVIDNYQTKAQDILEKFCDDKEELEPQIAVSVDMMDTGVDAPRVVNLVFFKPVKSYAKYWQMIGRGTRLRPNLFAPNQHKEFFMLFDFCSNIEFFEDNPEGITASVIKGLSQRIFETKLDVVLAIRGSVNATEEQDDLANEYTNQLHQVICGLDKNRFEVKKVLRTVDKYSIISSWQNINKGDVIEIQENLSKLASNTDEEKAKRFDLLNLKFMLALIAGDDSVEAFISNIWNIGKKLQEKRNIPMVQEKLPFIKTIQTDVFWENVSVNNIEKVRLELRDLIKFLEEENLTPVYSTFEDEIYLDQVAETNILDGYTKHTSYKERVESFIRKNKSNLVISKLHKNIPITQIELELLESFVFNDEVGSKQEYTNTYDISLAKFVRSVVGLDIEVANQLFADFIQSHDLSPIQITFINKMKEFLNQNGVLEKSLLVEQPPFTTTHDEGIMGLFEENDVVQLVGIIDKVNMLSIA